MKNDPAGISRRQFTYASAVALAAPMFIPSRLLSEESPSNTLNVAILPVILLLVLGAIWIYDRAKGVHIEVLDVPDSSAPGS